MPVQERDANIANSSHIDQVCVVGIFFLNSILTKVTVLIQREFTRRACQVIFEVFDPLAADDTAKGRHAGAFGVERPNDGNIHIQNLNNGLTKGFQPFLAHFWNGGVIN